MDASKLHELKEEVIVNIRAQLGANIKSGLTERELAKEYVQYNGRNIPFSALGYHSLYDLLKELNGKVLYTRRQDNLTLYYPILNDEHEKSLARLIHGQLDKNRAIRQNSRYREVQNQRSRVQYDVNNNNNNIVNNSSNRVPYNIQDQIKTVLIESKEKFLSRSNFTRIYYKKYGSFFEAQEFGFVNLVEMFKSLNSFIELRNIQNDDFLIYLTNSNSPLNGTLNTSTNTNNSNDSKERAVSKASTNDMKLNDVVVMNLKKIITDAKANGIWIRNIPSAYKNLTNKDLSVEMDVLGYKSVVELVSDKLLDYVTFEIPVKNGDILVFTKDSKPVTKIADLITEEKLKAEMKRKHNDNFSDLIQHTRVVFYKSKNLWLKLNEFVDKIEVKMSKKLNPNDYGCVNIEQLINKLNDANVVDFKYDENKEAIVKYRPLESEIKSQTQECQQNTYNNGSGVLLMNSEVQKRVFKEKFFSEIVSYYDILEPFEIFFNLDLTQKHKVIVSNIIDPLDVFIQLNENILALDKLMDQLETLYHGIGSSHYDMPREYIQVGRLCAAIFELDNNWHRCKIIEILEDKKLVRVLFVDYGGEGYVKINSLKFLSRNFIKLPIQAINVRLFGLTFFRSSTNKATAKWKPKTTEYLLNIIKEKVFTVTFNGIIDDALLITLSEEIQTPIKIEVSINNRILKEGYAEKINDRKNVEFKEIQSNIRMMIEPLNPSNRLVNSSVTASECLNESDSDEDNDFDRVSNATEQDEEKDLDDEDDEVEDKTSSDEVYYTPKFFNNTKKLSITEINSSKILSQSLLNEFVADDEIGTKYLYYYRDKLVNQRSILNNERLRSSSEIQLLKKNLIAKIDAKIDLIDDLINNFGVKLKN